MAAQSLAADIAPAAQPANAIVNTQQLPTPAHLLPDQLLVRLRTVLMRRSSLPTAPADTIDEQVQSQGVRKTWAASLAGGADEGTVGEGVAGEVEAVGSGLTSWYEVGDRVAGVGAMPTDDPEVVCLLAPNACPVPAAVSDDYACFAGPVAAAVQAARLVHPRLGDWLAVIGLQGDGLLAVQCAARAGARVLAVDPDERLLRDAEALGAVEVWNGEAADVGGDDAPAGPPVTDCHGVIVTAAPGIDEPLQAAIAVARRGAAVALLGIDPDSVPLRALTDKGLSLVVAHGPAVRASYPSEGEEQEGSLRNAMTLMALSHIRASRLPVQYVPISAVRDYYRVREEEASGEVEMPEQAAAADTGVEWIVIDFGHGLFDPEPPEDRVRSIVGRDPVARPCVVGVVGIDRAARTHLLPRLWSLPEVRLHTILSDRTMARDDVRRRFGFARSTTEPEAVLKAKDVSLVMMLEDYAQDVGLICKALANGKVVLADNPFVRDYEALEQVQTAQRIGGGVLQVGFHRRFSPLIQDARGALDGMRGRRQVVIHANAGRSLMDLRAAQAEMEADPGELRLSVEIGHFVDLAHHLIGAPITAVEASTPLAIGVVQDVAAQLHFADGSTATLVYTRFGETAFSRELVEVFADGATLRLDNLREMQRTEGAKRERCRSIQDRGHRAMLMAIADAITTGAPLPFAPAEQANVLRALLAMRRSIETGQRVTLG